MAFRFPSLPDVTAPVGNIDPRACDHDLMNVVGGLTGESLHPGVTRMNSISADELVNGHVYLDAGDDTNAFFIVRGSVGRPCTGERKSSPTSIAA